jgi:anaerobic carbon-monoxide dehydrogenase iron sulfur subunit
MSNATEQVLIVDNDRCTGCEICAMTCSMTKFGEYNPQKSHIKVIKNWYLDVNIPSIDMGCDYCGRCVEWCPTAALKIVSMEEAAKIRKVNRLGTFPAPRITGK